EAALHSGRRGVSLWLWRSIMYSARHLGLGFAAVLLLSGLEVWPFAPEVIPASNDGGNACVNPGVGAAADCTVLELDGGNVDLTGMPGGIDGDVCIGPNGKVSVTGSQFVAGSTLLARGATLSKSGPGSIGPVLKDQDLSAEINDAMTAATDA